MKQFGALLVAIAFSVGLKAQLPVPLGTAGNFAVLAGSTVTNTGNTIVTGGDVGVFAGSAVTGFPPGIIIGGVIHAADAVAATAQGDLTVAYVNAAGRPTANILPGDIGGLSFLPGVYRATSTLGITGTVTLNGNGDSNSVFIFQVGSALITAAGNSNVLLINGARASNVFWQVGSSATLGTNTVFNGTILAQASITLTTGAVLNGRALARVGAVTLDGNAVTNPGAAGVPTSLSVSCPFSSGQLGVAYTSALVGNGGLPPYTYSISAGTLPNNLLLNSATGAITGTPTVAGLFNFTARVQDAATTAATSSCSINILASAPALSLACAPGNGQVAVHYFSALVATGGTPAYTYSISAGSLPLGLTLTAGTGGISGTPTAAGTFSYTGRVADSAAGVATNTCSITILAAAPPPVPAPSSLILVVSGMALVGLFRSRDRLAKAFKRN